MGLKRLIIILFLGITLNVHAITSGPVRNVYSTDPIYYKGIDYFWFWMWLMKLDDKQLQRVNNGECIEPCIQCHNRERSK